MGGESLHPRSRIIKSEWIDFARDPGPIDLVWGVYRVRFGAPVPLGGFVIDPVRKRVSFTEQKISLFLGGWYFLDLTDTPLEGSGGPGNKV